MLSQGGWVRSEKIIKNKKKDSRAKYGICRMKGKEKARNLRLAVIRVPDRKEKH